MTQADLSGVEVGAGTSPRGQQRIGPHRARGPFRWRVVGEGSCLVPIGYLQDPGVDQP